MQGLRLRPPSRSTIRSQPARRSSPPCPVRVRGSCATNGQNVTCALGSLAIGAGTEVLITVNVPLASEGQTLSSTASVSADQPDPAMSNNTSTATTTIAAPTVKPGNLLIKVADHLHPVLGQPLHAGNASRVSASARVTVTPVDATDPNEGVTG